MPLISFTGETTTGQLIFRNASENLKGLSMELGGKSPAIVFADADLDAALDSTLFGVFSLNGERCTAGSRILVERGIYDDFVARYAARAKNIVVGDRRAWSSKCASTWRGPSPGHGDISHSDE